MAGGLGAGPKPLKVGRIFSWLPATPATRGRKGRTPTSKRRHRKWGLQKLKNNSGDRRVKGWTIQLGKAVYEFTGLMWRRADDDRNEVRRNADAKILALRNDGTIQRCRLFHCRR